MSLDVHIVTHTHWDREWYLPLERFRQRLVALVDELIDDPPARGESFLLDGQAIVVEDYLSVRPDRADALNTLLRDGRIEAGPWYVLADELIPSGEAIVRNLLTGRRLLRRRQASVPAVLYCPDSFGHPAALPSIAAGFGFELIVLWRGYGGARWPAGDTVRWIAPSGDEVLVFHLPRDGYEFGSHLPTDPEESVARWARMRAELATRSATGVLLIQNGADHHARQKDFRVALEALEDAGRDDGVHRSSLSEFANQLVRRAGARPLPSIQGELRDSYGYTWTLQGTFASRAHEKRMNARAERLLLREAEPWAALARFVAAGRPSVRPLIDEAWRTLLTAHPHDTLCGCSIDEVAVAMEQRIRSATNQGQGIRDDSIERLIGYDAVASRTGRDRWRPVVIVQNAAARKRSGVALLEIEEFIADVPVGPGSAPGVEPERSSDRGAGHGNLGLAGVAAVQVLSESIVNRRTESPRHYPDNDLVRITRVAAWISNVPGYGLSCFLIGDGDDARPAQIPDGVVVTEAGLSNAHLSIEIDGRGLVALTHQSDRRRIGSLFQLIDEADVGDLYTPAPRARSDEVEFRGARVVHSGPLCGAVELHYRVIDTTDARRGADVDLFVQLSLDTDAEFLRVAVHGENRRENHRLRLRVNSDVRDGEVWADAAFGVVRRNRIDVDAVDERTEIPPPTAPLHRYVSHSGDAVGVTLFSDGLAEYEASDDGSLTVTLVRSVGELSRNDLPERPGHAGWPSATPGAQCLGPFAAELALLFHGPRDSATIDVIERTADDVLLPLVGRTLRSALRAPEWVPGVELIGTGLAFSAMKESEDGAWLVMRCVNLSDETVPGAWWLPFEAQEARLARIDETSIQELDICFNVVAFVAPPRAIVTMLVR